MIVRLRALACDETGTAIVEYALIVALVSLVSFVGLMAIGTALQSLFAASAADLGSVVLSPQ